jgi:hypothetical protein
MEAAVSGGRISLDAMNRRGTPPSGRPASFMRGLGRVRSRDVDSVARLQDYLETPCI